MADTPQYEDVDITPSLEEAKNERAMAAVRLIVSLVTIVNIVAQPFGWQPLGIDSEALYLVISTAGAIVANIWTWWKNNNCTEAAVAGQKLADAIKEGKL